MWYLFSLFTNYSLSTKQYSIQSLVQYEAYDQNVFDPSQSLQLASSSSSSDISNLTTLYESRTNYLKVIKDLNLNIKINDLNDNESIDFKIIAEEDDPVVSNKLKFSFSENEYALLDEDPMRYKPHKYGEKILYNELIISINSVKFE